MRTRNTSYFITVMIILIPFVLLSRGVEAGQDSPDIKKLWGELLKREPFAYTIPLVHKPGFLDGTYTKRAKKTNAIVLCRRCPDWLPETGIWKMKLNKGTYRIIHKATGWKNIGTFIVAGDRVLLANDPVCPDGCTGKAKNLRNCIGNLPHNKKSS